MKEDLAADEVWFKHTGNKAKGGVDLGSTQPQAKRPRRLGPILETRFPSGTDGCIPPGKKEQMEEEREKRRAESCVSEEELWMENTLSEGSSNQWFKDTNPTKKPRLSGIFQSNMPGEMEPGYRIDGSGEMQPDPSSSSSSR